MTSKTENLTPQQSLELITSMINQAKGNIQRSSFYFLLWGWTIVIANLGVYLLLNFTSAGNPFLMFGLTIPAAVISIVHGARNKASVVHTHLERVHNWLWFGFGVTGFILVVFGKQTNWQINPLVITMCAVPTFISGILLRFRPLMFGGLAFWLFGIASFLAPLDIQFLLGALAVAVGYLVPGYLLKKSES